MAKTALELTREEWKQYNPLRPRQELVDEARRARGWEVARTAAALLREPYGATPVVAFGSLVHGEGFTERSD
ncbi:MAG: hypothetical protein KDD73_08230 [Anaerolineales bacterium]|nr:hypothetical protein [Anaerolineales bacterium]MCB9127650.1 hypothetical protein [Ardenticatenales bacterium]